MCGPAEMNGYAFCLGLSKLKLSYGADSGLQGRIRSVMYLIQGAIFRPRLHISIPILSLGELIDMYHTREATKRHDKIYALLGMSFDGSSLFPNYQATWKETLQQLVEFLICEEISVETWNEREMAVIKTKGCIIGRVYSVENDRTHSRQHVTIIFQNTSTSLEYRRKWGDRWTLQASAKSIRKGDVVCLLQGAPKPTIIRPRKDHFAVIVITVPRQGIQSKCGYVDHRDSLPSMEIFQRDFLLVWNWDESLLNLQGRASDETSIEISTLVSEYSMTASNKLASLYDVALILQDLKEYKEAGKMFQEIIEGYEGPSTEQHLYELAGMENSALVHKEKEEWKEAEEIFLKIIQRRKELQEGNHPDTLRSIAYLASTYLDQRTLSSEEQEMMEDLLNRIKDNLQILEEEVILVVKLFGVEILPLLLDLKGSKVQITEEVVKAAAENEPDGLMTLLPDQRQREEMAKAAAARREKVMALLLDRRGDEIPITGGVVKAAAENCYKGKDLITLLLDRRGNDIPITEEVVMAAVESEKVMTLLLDRRGGDIQITEEVVKAAAGNTGSVMKLLLDRRDDIPITEEVVKAAAGNMYHGEVMTLLLDRRGDDIPITEEVVKAAAGNRYQGEVMALLLDRRGDNIPITEEVVKAAAGNRYHGEVMTLLLDRRENDIQITEEVVKTAAENTGSMMKLLLDRGGDNIPITEEVVKAATGNKHHGEIIKLILDRRGDNIPITEEVVKIAAGNKFRGDRVMALLLDRRGDDIPITEEVVKTAAGNKNYGDKVMTLLLDRRGDDISITKEVLKAAAGNKYHGDKIMTLLLDRRGDDIQITEEVVMAAAGNKWTGKEVMTLLLDQRDGIPITEDVVKAAAGNEEGGHEVVSLFLKQYANKLHITNMLMNADMVKVAATCGQTRVLDLLYSQYKFEDWTTWTRVAQLYNAAKDGHLHVVKRLLRNGVVPDLKNIRGVTPLWRAASGGHVAVVKALLATGTVDVNSQCVSGRTPLFCAATRGYAEIVQLLLDNGAHLHYEDIDGRTPISAAREGCHANVIKILTDSLTKDGL